MHSNVDIRRVKEKIRYRIWGLMEERNIARFPRPVYGRIPNFIGAEKAAKRFISSKIFENADVIFCCPDSPQKPVREAVLEYGKTLIMATPRLRKGFIILKREYVPRGSEWKAATIRGAFRYGRIVEIIPYKVDVKVTGSVAVTIEGARLGKGGGYSDLEYAILRELGLVDEKTPIVTTVHDIQIVGEIPMTKHDMPVDYIYTPTRSIEVKPAKYQKPKGIFWNELDPKYLKLIPILSKIRRLKVGND